MSERTIKQYNKEKGGQGERGQTIKSIQHIQKGSKIGNIKKLLMKKKRLGNNEGHQQQYDRRMLKQFSKRYTSKNALKAQVSKKKGEKPGGSKKFKKIRNFSIKKSQYVNSKKLLSQM